jgi:predicted nucleic acid-binding protein
MRTATDTNIISALWSREPTALQVTRRLDDAKAEGGLVIAAPVYAELLAYPGATESFVNEFFADTGISVDFALQPAVWLEAGRRFAQYANRRRQATGESPKRLLTDFVIGAHALLHADRLMTLDPIRYRQDFPELLLMSIS